MRRALSLGALTVLDAGPLETIRIAGATGCSHVGLRPVAATPTEKHWPMLQNKALAADIGATLAGENIAVLDVGILRLTPPDLAAV